MGRWSTSRQSTPTASRSPGARTVRSSWSGRRRSREANGWSTNGGAMAAPEARPVRERLSGATLLITGATGFVGKSVLTTCLRELDSSTRIVLVVRAADDSAAQSRIEAALTGDERLERY